jgi:DNA-directed RNA polymerase specialized sigma subunit
MEPRITFEQVEPTLHKWGQYYFRLYRGVFEVWELINAAWADGGVRHLPQSKLKLASKRIRWDILHYIRKETKFRYQTRWNKSDRHWPKFYHISALDNTEEDEQLFVETYETPGKDSEQKDLVSSLVNHPSLSRREKLLMRLIYIEGYTCKEAGGVCGYTESWIWQLRENILERLKAMDLSKAV